MEVKTFAHSSLSKFGRIKSKTGSRIYQADLGLFLQSVSQGSVSLFIREVCGTHYSRLYIMLKVLDETGEFTWVHEVFSNFSSDWGGRKKSMEMAIQDSVKVKSNLDENGFQIRQAEGLNCNNWSPCEVHRTSHYCLDV